MTNTTTSGDAAQDSSAGIGDYTCYNCGGKESAHFDGCPAIRTASRATPASAELVEGDLKRFDLLHGQMMELSEGDFVLYEDARAAIAADRASRDDPDEDAYVIDRMGKLLAGVAVALKGPEEARQRHGYQDLPDEAAKVMAELAQLRASRDQQPSVDK